MTSAEYTEIFQTDIQDRVRKRYAPTIDILLGLGFKLQSFYGSTLPPFSAITYLPVLLLMLINREVIWVHDLLQLSVANPLLIHRSPATHTEIMAFGAKYYTYFKDGTILVTASFRSSTPSIRGMERQAVIGITEAWQAHQNRVSRKEQEGVQMETSLNLDRYLKIVAQEDSSVL